MYFDCNLQLLSETFLRDMLISLHVKNPSFLSYFNQPWFSRHIFEKYPNNKFHQNPSRGRCVVPCGRTDMTKCWNSAHATKNAASHRNTCTVYRVVTYGRRKIWKNMANIIGNDHTYVYLAYVRSHVNRSSNGFLRHPSTVNYITFLFWFNSLCSQRGYYRNLFRFLCLKSRFRTDRLQRQSHPANQ